MGKYLEIVQEVVMESQEYDDALATRQLSPLT